MFNQTPLVCQVPPPDAAPVEGGDRALSWAELAGFDLPPSVSSRGSVEILGARFEVRPHALPALTARSWLAEPARGFRQV